jgi:hypothetical protein
MCAVLNKKGVLKKRQSDLLMKNSERVCVYSYEGVSDVPLAEGGTILY